MMVIIGLVALFVAVIVGLTGVMRMLVPRGQETGLPARSLDASSATNRRRAHEAAS